MKSHLTAAFFAATMSVLVLGVAAEANAATATAEPASLRVKVEGLRLQTVLNEDKRNLWSGALRALGFRPETPACRQATWGNGSGVRDGAVQGTGPLGRGLAHAGRLNPQL